MLKGREVLAYLAIRHNGDWDKIYQAVMSKEDVGVEEKVLKALQELNCDYVTLIDENYPERLKEIYKPPFVLFYHGNLDLMNTKILAIVGSNQINKNTKETTESIIADLKGEMTIANVIDTKSDTISQEQAINTNTPRIVFMHSGIQNPCPTDNVAFNHFNKENTLFVSEYPNKINPTKEQLKRAMRVMSYTCNKLLVTYATNVQDSVAIIGAISKGVDIYVIPQQARSKSKNNALITQGATLAETAETILKD